MTNAQTGNSFDGSIENELGDVFAELTADDGRLHAAIVIRDKQRPYDAPTTLRVSDIGEIKDFLDNIPNQVHVLVVKKDDLTATLKLSLTSTRKTQKYNVHCVDKSKISDVFDSELFKQVSDKVDEALWPDLFAFLGGQEEQMMTQEEFDLLLSQMGESV